MVETIAGIIGGGLAVTAFIFSRKKLDTTFTIKSDKSSSVKVGGYQSEPPRERPTAPPPPQSIKSSISTEIKSMDMKNVNGIRFQGSGDLHLNNGRLFVDEGAEVYVKSQTLWVESKGNVISVSGGMFASARNYTETKTVEVPLEYFDVGDISRVSLSGSGDLKLSNIKTKALDIIVQGSGDVELHNVSTGTLELTVKGSGDINVDKNCRATQTLASVKGSGDISIKSSNVGAVAKKIKGSGDIKAAGGKSSKKSQKKDFNQSSNWTHVVRTTISYD